MSKFIKGYSAYITFSCESCGRDIVRCGYDSTSQEKLEESLALTSSIDDCEGCGTSIAGWYELETVNKVYRRVMMVL